MKFADETIVPAPDFAYQQCDSSEFCLFKLYMHREKILCLNSPSSAALNQELDLTNLVWD